MTWQECSLLLHNEWKRLDGQPLGVLIRETGERLNEMAPKAATAEQSRRVTLEAAIEKFASERAWPDLPGAELYLLEQRLFYGYMLAFFFARHEDKFVPNLPALATDAERIKWLLVDCWNDFGCQIWIGIIREKVKTAQGPPRAQ
jgi:hypothetical protein